MDVITDEFFEFSVDEVQCEILKAALEAAKAEKKSQLDGPPAHMHRFWEDETFDEELSNEQAKFINSRQRPSANVTRRPQTEVSSVQIVEVDPTPLEVLPASIIPNFDETNDGERDKIDIMGPIDASALPGVKLPSSTSFSSSRPKKSLFARQQAIKREHQPVSSNPSAFNTAKDTTDAGDSILADPIERDVVSFAEHPISSTPFATHDRGFPDAEKIDINPHSTGIDAAQNETGFSGSDAGRVFYSSARERLDSVSTVDVPITDEPDKNESFRVEKTSIPSTAQSSFSALMQDISSENDASMAKMTPVEVEKLQQELLSHLNPKFLEMLRERGKQKAIASKLEQHASAILSDPTSQPPTTEASNKQAKTKKDEWSVTTSTGTYTIPPTRGKTNRSNTFLEDMEKKKREWLLPVKRSNFPTPSSLSAAASSDNFSQSDEAATERGYMNAELYRFDFEGRLLSYPSPKGNVDVEKPGKSQDLNMLLHHGEDPTDPGYTMNELNHLSRSTHPSQRISSIRALGNIIYKAKHCYYTLPSLNIPSIGAFAAFPNNLFLSHLMQTLTVAIGLRVALDDTSNTQILEALYAIHALLCTESDEDVSALAALSPCSIYYYPMKPRDDENISLSLRDWDDKSDAERCEIDLVLALLQTGLLSRLRYILESKSSPTIIALVLQIMIRCARHSQEACDHFKQCPGLIPLFKKMMAATQGHVTTMDPNTTLLIKLILLICQGSRSVCESCIQSGIIASCFKFVQLPYHEEKNSDHMVMTALHSLQLLETCIRYGMFKSSIINIMSLLMDLVTNAQPYHPSTRKSLVQAATWRLLTSLVPLARDIPEGEDIPTYVVLWSHISPIVPHALTCLRAFDQVQESNSDQDSLLAAIFEFLASYFAQLESHPPRAFETEKRQVQFISQQTLAPFLISSPYFTSLVTTLSSRSSWVPGTLNPRATSLTDANLEPSDSGLDHEISVEFLSSNQKVKKSFDFGQSTQKSPNGVSNLPTAHSAYMNVVPSALYAIPLASHPAWTWKAQPSLADHAKGGGVPLQPLELSLTPILAPAKVGSTLLHQASVLLSALHVTAAVSAHDPWLSARLTASEIANPLTLLLEHYSEWALQCSGSLGSVYSARTLHLLAYQTIMLLYKTSITAQESGLVCLAHLLPGDELLAQRLIQRVTLYYIQDDPNDMAATQSLAAKLKISPGTLAYLIKTIMDGLGGDKPRSERLYYLTEEDHPCDRESLLIDAEASAQPLGKHWVYNVFTHYTKHRAIEENELAYRRQKEKSDAIKRGIEAHLAAKAKNMGSVEPSMPGQEDVNIPLEEGMDLFGEYETPESKQLRAAGISLIRDSLQFAVNVESSNTRFAVKMKRSVKLYSILQVFTLGPAFFTEPSIAESLSKLLDLFVRRGWEPTTLDRSIILNTALIEKIADTWANESFGDATIGKTLALWILAGASIDASQILASGQSSELQSIDSAIWPHFATLWHLLPNPPTPLQEQYFQENIAHRPLPAEYLLLAICSPHTPKMASQWNFWYRFIIFQLSRYFFSEHKDGVNQWIRKNAIISLLNDLEALPKADQMSTISDLFSLSRHELIQPQRTTENQTLFDFERRRDGLVEYLLDAIRPTISPANTN